MMRPESSRGHAPAAAGSRLADPGPRVAFRFIGTTRSSIATGRLAGNRSLAAGERTGDRAQDQHFGWMRGWSPGPPGVRTFRMRAANLSAGNVNTARVAGVYGNITGIGTQAQTLNMNSNLISGLATPSAATDAATKGYVDLATATLSTGLLASTNVWTGGNTYISSVTFSSNVVLNNGGIISGIGSGLTT